MMHWYSTTRDDYPNINRYSEKFIHIPKIDRIAQIVLNCQNSR